MEKINFFLAGEGAYVSDGKTPSDKKPAVPWGKLTLFFADCGFYVGDLGFVKEALQAMKKNGRARGMMAHGFTPILDPWGSMVGSISGRESRKMGGL